MDEKYQQLIEALAVKLGTTAEHLWGVLVRQAPISGAVDLVLCILIAAVTAWWVRLVMRKTKCPNETEDNRYPRAEWQNEGAFIAWIVTVIAGVMAMACIIGSGQGIVAAFANLEYWALMKLVK